MQARGAQISMLNAMVSTKPGQRWSMRSKVFAADPLVLGPGPGRPGVPRGSCSSRVSGFSSFFFCGSVWLVPGTARGSLSHARAWFRWLVADSSSPAPGALVEFHSPPGGVADRSSREIRFVLPPGFLGVAVFMGFHVGMGMLTPELER